MKNAVDLTTLITLHSSNDNSAKQAVETALQPIISDKAQLKTALTQQDADGNSPLHWAIEHELIDVTNSILTVAATNNLLKDILILRDKDGNSPFNAAILANKEEEIIKALFNSLFDHPGILKTVLELGNKEGTLPLHTIIALEKKQLLIDVLADATTKNVIKDLLEVKDIDGKAALHKAAYEEKEEIVDVILQAIGNEAKLQAVTFTQDNDGNSPLHWAVEMANVSIITKFMVKVSEEMLSVKDVSGNSPLNAAILGDKGNAVIKAILNGVPVNLLAEVLLLSNDENDPDNNPLKALIATKNNEIFAFIAGKAKAAGKLPELMSLQAQKGKTLLQTAESEDASDITVYLGQLIHTQCKDSTQKVDGKGASYSFIEKLTFVLFENPGLCLLKLWNLSGCIAIKSGTRIEGVYTVEQLIKASRYGVVAELVKQEAVDAIKAGAYTAEQLINCRDTLQLKELVKQEAVDAIKAGAYTAEQLINCRDTLQLEILVKQEAVDAIKAGAYTAEQLINCRDRLQLKELVKQEAVDAIKKGVYTSEDLISFDWSMIGFLVKPETLERVEKLGKMVIFASSPRFLEVLKYNMEKGGAAEREDTEESLLSVALHNSNKEAVKYLLSNGQHFNHYDFERIDSDFAAKLKIQVRKELSMQEVQQAFSTFHHSNEVIGCKEVFEDSCLIEPKQMIAD